LQHQLFAAWRSGDIRTLFCPGIPGAGKTIIASIVIQCIWSAQHDRESGVAFLYCNYERQNEQTTEVLLAILLRQLAEHHPSIPDPVKLLHTSHTEKRTRPSLQETYDTLCDVAKSYKRLFLVVDALDECLDDTRKTLLLQLKNLQRTTGSLLMATSRHLDTLEQEFKGVAQIKIQADAGDVDSYLDGQRATLPECVKVDSTLWQIVKDRIVGTVDGMCVSNPTSSIAPTFDV
jgi:Cdc6-like AAA superfamily ATPase